jgi:hypothetical protein
MLRMSADSSIHDDTLLSNVVLWSKPQSSPNASAKRTATVLRTPSAAVLLLPLSPLSLAVVLLPCLCVASSPPVDFPVSCSLPALSSPSVSQSCERAPDLRNESPSLPSFFPFSLRQRAFPPFPPRLYTRYPGTTACSWCSLAAGCVADSPTVDLPSSPSLPALSSPSASLSRKRAPGLRCKGDSLSSWPSLSLSVSSAVCCPAQVGTHLQACLPAAAMCCGLHSNSAWLGPSCIWHEMR